MKNTRLKIVLLITLSLMVSSAFAQTERKSRDGGKNNTEKIDKEVEELSVALDLTADQKKEFRLLIEAHYKEVKSMRDANKEDKEAAKEAMKPLKKELETKLIALMTTKQKEQFKAFKKKKRDQKSQKGNAKTQ